MTNQNSKNKRSLRTAIKNQDLFGHVININYDKQGNTFNTFFGGWVSLFVKAVLLVYIAL